MKSFGKIFSILILISVVLTAFLPTGTALAAKDPGSAVLVIHNNTGGKVNFGLLDGQGHHLTYSLPTGQTTLSLDAAMYSYFAGLSCGSLSGQFNLNVGKQLYFTCGGGADMVVRKTAGLHNNYCYNIYDVYSDEDLINQNFLKGIHCQGTPALEWDFILYPSDGFWSTDGVAPAAFFNDFPSYCLPDQGPAYYGFGYYIEGRLICR